MTSQSFWWFLTPPVPIVRRFYNYGLVLLSQNPIYPLPLRLLRHLWTSPKTKFIPYGFLFFPRLSCRFLTLDTNHSIEFHPWRTWALPSVLFFQKKNLFFRKSFGFFKGLRCKVEIKINGFFHAEFKTTFQWVRIGLKREETGLNNQLKLIQRFIIKVKAWSGFEWKDMGSYLSDSRWKIKVIYT